MTRMMATGAVTLALLVTTPSFAGEPVRLAERDLDQVTAGWLSNAGPFRDGILGIPVPRVPTGGGTDDDIWDLLGSGVVGQGGLLERFRGFLLHVHSRPG